MRFEDAVRLGDPLAAPVEIFFVVLAVVVLVVLKADVERRIGKDEVDRPVVDLLHQLRYNRLGESFRALAFVVYGSYARYF